MPRNPLAAGFFESLDGCLALFVGRPQRVHQFAVKLVKLVKAYAGYEPLADVVARIESLSDRIIELSEKRQIL